MNIEGMPSYRSQFVDLIAHTLNERREEIKGAFASSKHEVDTRYVVIDDFLPLLVAQRIGRAFPEASSMRLMNSFREKKYTSKNFDQFDPILGDITFSFQNQKIVELIGDLTDIKEQIPDGSLYAGGLSTMTFGCFLMPHIDNSHDSSRTYYRTLNLLYYATEDWAEVNGGNLQLWDCDVRNAVTIHSKFNRLVLMETTPTSWHSVNPVLVEASRNCVSNYYFSRRSPTGEDYFNVTSFAAPPSQPLLRMRCKLDALARQLVRKFHPDGVGQIDVYDNKKR
jgi:Rps23 Pro-64 3,4-dihydroxylase Tpa1-like proline 4-hydroxylase